MDPVVVEYGTPPQARELERQVERQHCRRSLAVGSCQEEEEEDKEAALVVKDHVVTQIPALEAVVAWQHPSALVGRQVLAGHHRYLGVVEPVVTDSRCGHQA